MKRQPADNDWSPRPEELAAYADGEVDPTGPGVFLRQRIEAWLGDHAEAAAEVEAQRRLVRLWKSTAAQGPGEAVWDDLAQRIRQATPESAARLPHALGRRLALVLTVVAAAAAAVMVAINLGGPGPQPERIPAVGAADAVEPLPVATDDEIEVVRVNGDATDGLVVGELPVRGALELAKPGEVVVQKIEPNKNKTMPEVRNDGPGPPMVWISSGAGN
jgi:anti-sigma factor RsiW